MIIPPTKSFFAIHISGEATDVVTNKFSPEVTSDIREVILISDDYATDFEAHYSLDTVVEKLRSQIDLPLEEEIKFNPLYSPSTVEEIDRVLEAETCDNFRFTGFEGNPFTMKSIALSNDDQDLICARVACHQFDLPSYTEIMDSQTINRRLN